MSEATTRNFKSISIQDRLTQIENELYHMGDKLIELSDGIDGLYGAIRRITSRSPRRVPAAVNKHTTITMFGEQRTDISSLKRNGNGQNKEGSNS